jgi:kumamolisin
MTDEPFVQLPGSERSAAPGVRLEQPLGDDVSVELTLVLRRRADLPSDLVSGRGTVSTAELRDSYGADPADIERVMAFLTRSGVQVLSVDQGSRRIRVRGTGLASLFGTTLTQATSPDPVTGRPMQHRHREGALHIPAELDGIVTAVLGLDDRPQSRAHFRLAASASASVSYTPVQLGQEYDFPSGTDGTGHSLAIIELGGGFDTADLDTYFSGLGVPSPSVTAVGVDGASNVPDQDPNGADGEVLLDIEVAGALAPGAAQFVYFAPNTDAGFLDAISQAVHATPTPTAISISWGGPENTWTAQARTTMDAAFADAAALGITVTVAAGDNGSSDGQTDGQPHVDFPAASPNVLACGGTSLPAIGTSENVWNDGAGGGATGGGVSTGFPQPSWQQNAGVPSRSGGTAGAGRGVPDVAGDADPATGYQVRVDGQPVVVGGTSAVAPLWAALAVRLSQATGRSLGLLQPSLYAGISPGSTTPGFRDVVSGNNGDYTAQPGYDACTGLGTPIGSQLITRLA